MRGATLAVLVAFLAATVARGQVPGSPGGGRRSVVDTVHNLSVEGPGEIKSTTEKEVCKFCHIPHATVEVAPLWGHVLSEARYQMPRRGRGGAPEAVQPDGASRLCLSCHDGTVALGAIGRFGEMLPVGGGSHLGPDRPGFLGTDLSGSHPISIPYPETVGPVAQGDADMGLRPRGQVELDRDVNLDADGKVQCTTCHDAHADAYFQPGRVPHFWVKPTITEVCETCHVLR